MPSTLPPKSKCRSSSHPLLIPPLCVPLSPFEFTRTLYGPLWPAEPSWMWTLPSKSRSDSIGGLWAISTNKSPATIHRDRAEAWRIGRKQAQLQLLLYTLKGKVCGLQWPRGTYISTPTCISCGLSEYHFQKTLKGEWPHFRNKYIPWKNEER